MSYILDALRKSEQERMRGKLPDLNHYGDEDKRTSNSQRWLWLMGGGLIIVNVVGVALWLTRSEPPTIDAAKNVATSKEIVKPAVPDSGTPANPTVNSLPAVAQPTLQVPQTSLPVGTVLVAPPPAGVAMSTALPPGTVYYVAPALPTTGQPIVVAPGTAVQGGAVQSPPPAASWGNSASNVQPPPPVPPPPLPDRLEQAIDPGVVASPSVSYLPQLDELPAQLRQQIPDMTFSSHMFSSMARFRSVVINGNRVKEGQVVANNIQVKEITETGVILSVGDTLFQVDVLGKWSQ